MKTWLTMEHADEIRRGVIHAETEGGIELTNRFKDQAYYAHAQWVIWRKMSDHHKERASGWRLFAIYLLIYTVAASDFFRGFLQGFGG
jgi:hypothetical protein